MRQDASMSLPGNGDCRVRLADDVFIGLKFSQIGRPDARFFKSWQKFALPRCIPADPTGQRPQRRRMFLRSRGLKKRLPLVKILPSDSLFDQIVGSTE
jgi:hypothetical protein